MGTVYHAELRVPRGFARTCAVKVMKSQGPDHEHFLGRMRDEARLLGMLQDEQILGVSELVQVEGRDAVIMEFVEGVDLSMIIRQGQVPAQALAELGAEVAGSLHRAHTAKHPQTGEPLRVIHRDIKPANIMLTSRGGVRVLDFGVARAAFGSRESHTQGLVLGTLNYFPPEILAGHDPTPAVDIYGLGLTLWECATGREWGAPRVQRAQFERRVDQRIAQLGPDYAPVVPVLRQVLQWDPELRPDGGGMERMLLSASRECAGEGLRTWSRDVIPRMLTGTRPKPAPDPLVGRTIRIDVHSETPKPVPARDASAFDAPPPDPSHLSTFDDFGPPAATSRPRPLVKEPPRERRAAARAAAAEKARPAQRSGPPMLVIALMASLFGLVIGLLAIAIVALVLILWFWS